jgi:hypothetical protein
LAPFCQAVSEEKIFLNSSQSETRISLGGHICWWNGTKWITRLGVIVLFSSFFSSPGPKGEVLPSLGVRRPSFNFFKKGQ